MCVTRMGMMINDDGDGFVVIVWCEVLKSQHCVCFVFCVLDQIELRTFLFFYTEEEGRTTLR